METPKPTHVARALMIEEHKVDPDLMVYLGTEYRKDETSTSINEIHFWRGPDQKRYAEGTIYAIH